MKSVSQARTLHRQHQLRCLRMELSRLTAGGGVLIKTHYWRQKVDAPTLSHMLHKFNASQASDFSDYLVGNWVSQGEIMSLPKADLIVGRTVLMTHAQPAVPDGGVTDCDCCFHLICARCVLSPHQCRLWELSLLCLPSISTITALRSRVQNAHWEGFTHLACCSLIDFFVCVWEESVFSHISISSMIYLYQFWAKNKMIAVFFFTHSTFSASHPELNWDRSSPKYCDLYIPKPWPDTSNILVRGLCPPKGASF